MNSPVKTLDDLITERTQPAGDVSAEDRSKRWHQLPEVVRQLIERDAALCPAWRRSLVGADNLVEVLTTLLLISHRDKHQLLAQFADRLFREPAPLLVAEPLSYEGDPAVRALADRIGELVQHMERCGKRSDRLQLMSMKQALRRHEAGSTSAAEYEEGLRELREDIAALEVEVTGRRAAPAPGPTLAQRAANELVLGLQALPDHNALRNAVWRALRVLDNDAAEELAQRAYVAPSAAGVGEVTVVQTPPSGDVPRNPYPLPPMQMPGSYIELDPARADKASG